MTTGGGWKGLDQDVFQTLVLKVDFEAGDGAGPGGIYNSCHFKDRWHDVGSSKGFLFHQIWWRQVVSLERQILWDLLIC